MIRRLFLIALMLTVLAGLMALSSFGKSNGPFTLLSPGGVRPSKKPLPSPWSAVQLPPVKLYYQPSVLSGAAPTACPSIYIVQRGDTAGSIARSCGITLQDLLAANPTLTNADKIYSGQELAVYRAPQRDDGYIPLPAHAQVPAGTVLLVQAEGFSSGETVRIGLGLSESGFEVLASKEVETGGVISAQIIVPYGAAVGERGFVLVSGTGLPSLQVISEPFIVAP
jgi:LysM repeat protein